MTALRDHLADLMRRERIQHADQISYSDQLEVIGLYAKESESIHARVEAATCQNNNAAQDVTVTLAIEAFLRDRTEQTTQHLHDVLHAQYWSGLQRTIQDEMDAAADEGRQAHEDEETARGELEYERRQEARWLERQA